MKSKAECLARTTNKEKEKLYTIVQSKNSRVKEPLIAKLPIHSEFRRSPGAPFKYETRLRRMIVVANESGR